MPKISAKFQWDHPQQGTKYRRDGLQLAIFDQKRCKIGIQLLWNANRNSYVLYQMMLFTMTLSDPNYPKPPRFLNFVSPFHIFIVKMANYP